MLEPDCAAYTACRTPGVNAMKTPPHDQNATRSISPIVGQGRTERPARAGLSAALLSSVWSYQPTASPSLRKSDAAR